ncbi:hypothetical protein BC629DRAFT_1563556, partial [Irpex lacteus]
ILLTPAAVSCWPRTAAPWPRFSVPVAESTKSMALPLRDSPMPWTVWNAPLQQG